LGQRAKLGPTGGGARFDIHDLIKADSDGDQSIQKLRDMICLTAIRIDDLSVADGRRFRARARMGRQPLTN
jgi:hypothetical protein